MRNIHIGCVFLCCCLVYTYKVLLITWIIPGCEWGRPHKEKCSLICLATFWGDEAEIVTFIRRILYRTLFSGVLMRLGFHEVAEITLNMYSLVWVHTYLRFFPLSLFRILKRSIWKTEREHHLTFTIAPRMITLVAFYLHGDVIRPLKINFALNLMFDNFSTAISQVPTINM